MDVAVAELDLSCVNRSLVYLKGLVGATHCRTRSFRVCFERIVGCAELFVLLAGHDALLNQGSITLDLVAAPVLTRNFRRQIGLSLFYVRSEWSSSDRKEQFALSDVGAVSEMNLFDAAGSLWLNCNGVTP